MLLAETESALANSLRFNNAGSFTADPVADTDPRCWDEFVLFACTREPHVRKSKDSLRPRVFFS